ncbi:MAG: phosphoglucomutase/phosphomannomutase family protein [Acidobacteriota bacterium]|nr:phosphoglucomutase/phosphomannomutase family protein [Acidobacteriota bacterium]MDQ5837324.1 phosphoglucomutase/phosphomannomutase family protein [Acidobacteriota bacterium]
MTHARAGRTPIRFGTDGWRARIADEFTFENVERVAQAYADFLNQQQTDLLKQQRAAEDSGRRGGKTAARRGGKDSLSGGKDALGGGDSPSGGRDSLIGGRDSFKKASARHPHVVVGYDRRFLSERFAERAAEVLSGNQIAVSLFGSDVPTPLVSWAVRERGAAGGVVITASHNPPDFNGFKIKAPWGGSATAETTVAVESLLDAQTPQLASIPEGARGGLGREVESYREKVSEYVDLARIRSARARVVVDPMHGTGGRWVESFLRGGRLASETIRAERDPLFGGVNPEPIDRNLAPLKEGVLNRRALVGLATDGDADRVGAVNERGETMTMHEVVPVVLLHLARRRLLSGGVVRTFSQSVLLKRIAAALGLTLHETPIGFKYIADLMLREDILIGAEESGGIGVRGHIPERDGILNSLLLLEAVVAACKTPTELVAEMHREFGEFYFGRRDLQMEVARGLALVGSLATRPPAAVEGFDVQSVETLDGTKLVFGDESWLLFRQSGTEPVLRVYAEATSVPKRETLLDEGCRLAHEFH